MKIVLNTVILTIALGLLWHSGALAEGLILHGFLQGNYSANTENENPDGNEFKWAEERAQFKLEGYKAEQRFFLKTDVFYDHIDEKADVEVREAYIDSSGGLWDARIGRQIITWGVGDLVFINDVFPKDHEAFFSGRPMEYLKKGSDALKVSAYPEFASFELVVTPFFEPDNMPRPARFWMYDPMPQVTNREAKEPAANLKNTEIALRAYRDLAGFESSFYFYKGFYRTPSMQPDSLSAPTKITLHYPELLLYGFSLQKSALDGVVSLEAGYLDSSDDKAGTNPLIPNHQAKVLVAYQRQIIEDMTMTTQYLGEYMLSYDAYEANRIQGFPKEPEYRQLLSLRLQYLMMSQTMRLGWFSFWSPTDKDYLLNPEVRYSFTDNLWGAIGALVYGGRSDTTRFGSLDKNDNVYTQARYEF
ncbi:MAG: hypothetical protein AABY45_03625 [Deltaproteobacteria bacterium]